MFWNKDFGQIDLYDFEVSDCAPIGYIFYTYDYVVICKLFLEQTSKELADFAVFISDFEENTELINELWGLDSPNGCSESCEVFPTK